MRFVYLGHHATPSNEIGGTSCSRALLQIDNSLEKAIEVVVSSIIELLEAIEALGQVCAEGWRVIVS